MKIWKTPFAERIFKLKYAWGLNDTWADCCKRIIESVVGGDIPLMSKEDRSQLYDFLLKQKFIPGGRYIYYSGRPLSYWSNCFLLDVEDERESWANLLKNATSCLMMGGGIGVVYSKLRGRGSLLKRTGGVACLTGDTVLFKDRKKSGKENQITIKRLYDLSDDKKSRVLIRSLDEYSGSFFRNRVVSVVRSGVAPVFKLTTENGYSIRATGNHRFMMEGGVYKSVDELQVGDRLAVNRCENSFGDAQGHHYVSSDMLISIKELPPEEVFDIEMEGPNHNFVANGFVSHNSGPIPLMQIVNELGRNVQQGGSRRSAIWAGLNWKHSDIEEFLYSKNWNEIIVDLKSKDFNFPAPLDMTNISILWDDDFVERNELWENSIRQMVTTGEPGHSYNFGEYKNEILRNAYVVCALIL